jgi:hypothetical protein
MNKPFLALLFAAVAGHTNAFARCSEACFTKDEAQMMLEKRDTISKASADCMTTYWETHQAFYQKNGYSKYFGVRNHSLDSPDKRAKAILFALWPDFMSESELTNFDDWFKKNSKITNPVDNYEGLSDLETYLRENNPNLYNQLMQRKPSLDLEKRAQEERGHERGGADLRGDTDSLEQNISCVDMSRRCLEAGFNAAGMHDTFEKIDHVVMAHQVSGTEVQKGLADLGWRTIFFDPDPSQNAAFDEDDRKANPATDGKKWMGSWGGAADSYASVMRRGYYPLGTAVPIPIDDKRLLVGFHTTVPEDFKKVPYFIGTAHGGYHVFPGYYGNIIEAHSVRALGSENNLEMSVFNPIDQADHGGPRWTDIEHYKTGVIVVPPGYLDDGSQVSNAGVDAHGCLDLRPGQR